MAEKNDETLEMADKNLTSINFFTTQICDHTILISII